MAGVILTSGVLIVLGLLAALVGFTARRIDSRYGRHLLAIGGVLVLVGLIGFGYFIRAFG